MAVLAGIDEAGFGPILGPLVVSATAFEVPDHLISDNLWTVLRKSVSQKRKALAGRLLIADSKKAYSKSLGIKHLQRTVLVCLKCLGAAPGGLGGLLSELCPDCVERLEDYPWHTDPVCHRISADRADIEIAASVFERNLAENGIKLLHMQSSCLDVAYYNRMVANVKNKASVLFSVTSQLIERAFDNLAGDNLQIIIDRQGGRVHYRKVLLRMFADMELKILRESPAHSSYELGARGKTMRLHFVVGADQRFLPVSLASMVSKYVRELLVKNINSYFTGFDAGLKPTAGYWKDGTRFIRDIKTNLPHVRIDDNQLIRCR